MYSNYVSILYLILHVFYVKKNDKDVSNLCQLRTKMKRKILKDEKYLALFFRKKNL